MFELALIYRPKLNSIGIHYGVSLGNGTVIDFQPEGARVISESEFAQSLKVSKGISRKVTFYEYHQIVSRLKELKYDLVANNCEHLSRLIVENKRTSIQISVVAGLTIITLLVLIFKKN